MALAAFAAYALDAVGVVVMLLATVAAVPVALGWHWANYQALVSVLMVFVATALLVSGSLWLLTLRHRLLASLLAFLGIASVVACLSYEWRTVNMMDARYMLSVGVLPYLLFAYLLGMSAYRRWMRGEWGLYGSP